MGGTADSGGQRGRGLCAQLLFCARMGATRAKAFRATAFAGARTARFARNAFTPARSLLSNVIRRGANLLLQDVVRNPFGVCRLQKKMRNIRRLALARCSERSRDKRQPRLRAVRFHVVIRSREFPYSG